MFKQDLDKLTADFIQHLLDQGCDAEDLIYLGHEIEKAGFILMASREKKGAEG